MENKKSQGIAHYQVSNGKSLSVRVFDETIGRTGIYNLRHTSHSQQRSTQRGISNLEIALAIEYGVQMLKQGLEFYVTTEKSLPHSLHHNIRERLKNTVVILTPDGEIVTCYRATNPLKRITKKTKQLL